MNHVIIVTAYIEAPLQMKQFSEIADFVICLDGGYDICLKSNIVPDLLMGDFDSIRSNLPDNIEIERFKPEKDYTDLELALQKSISLNAKEVTILGGIGGRLDHTVANLQLLSSYSDSFNSLTMLDGNNKCFILNENHSSITIAKEENSYISLFSISDKCHGLSATNVKYPLENHTLSRTYPLGVSNEFKGDNAAISLKSGTLLVIISKKN